MRQQLTQVHSEVQRLPRVTPAAAVAMAGKKRKLADGGANSSGADRALAVVVAAQEETITSLKQQLRLQADVIAGLRAELKAAGAAQ